MIEILMIEDDLEIAELLVEYLAKYDINVTNYDSPELGVSALRMGKYDLTILDLSLPEIDGVQVCRMIRERSDIPIIISSARSDISDKAACFKYGADDYLAKPYDSQELVLRINSVLKRGKARVGEKEESKRFLLDEQMREITKEGAVINLTNAEYQILAYLIKRSNFAISREEILLNVESIKYESSYKSIDVLIGRVRSKIEENPKEPQYIKSLRGIGYKLVN